MRKLLLAVGLATMVSGLATVGLFLVARTQGIEGSLLLAAALAVLVSGPLLTYAAATVYRRLIRPLRGLDARVERLERRLERMNADLQAHPLLYDRLDVSLPLPVLSGWTVTADQAAFLVDHVLAHGPAFAVELGSGASTVLLAEAMRSAGSGRVLSVDHEAAYADATAAALELRGLEEVAEVVHCPLTSLEEVDGDPDRVWYHPAFLDSLEPGSVDLLLVDGPPHEVCDLARLPAFPILREKLSPDCVVILDDIDRDDEEETSRRWCGSDPDLEMRTVPLSTPMAVFRWPDGEKPDARSSG